MTLFLAGHETTATALTWTTYLLARHPQTQAGLAEEVDRVLAGRPPGVDDLPRLGKVEMAFKESMRLYPPVYFFSREAAEEAEVAGYRVPRGSQVHLVPFIVHRDPRWFEQPGQFLPERFAPGREERLPPFAYFPFGGGPLACIGKGFALTEGVLVLATVLQRYHLSLAPGQGEPEWETQISLHPRGGVRLALTSRELAQARVVP
jgi:cytochrome P450